MTCRIPMRKTHVLLTCLFIAAALVCLTACPYGSGSGPKPVEEVSCLKQLSDVNKQSTEAAKLYAAGFETTSAGKEEFRKVAETIEKNILPCLKQNDQKVNAYALQAVADWRCGEYLQANQKALEGRSLYENAKLSTNRRDYGELISVPGCVQHSLARSDYLKIVSGANGRFLTKAEAQEFESRMTAAQEKLDEVNVYLAGEEDAAIWANAQQLYIMWDIIDMWTRNTASRADWAARKPVWLDRIAKISGKFPEGKSPKGIPELVQKMRDNIGPVNQ